MKSSPSYFAPCGRSLFPGLYLTAIAAVLFSFSSRDASAQNTWLGTTSDYNTASNWSSNVVPIGGYPTDAYFSNATPNPTITFSAANVNIWSILFSGNSAGDTLGAAGGVNGLSPTSGAGIYVRSSLQGSNGTITINVPIQDAGLFYLDNYSPGAGQNSVSSLPGQAGSGTGNVLDVNSTITGTGSVNLYGIGDVNVAGNLQNAGNVIIDTTGKVTFSGVNTYTGYTQVGGTLVLDNSTNNGTQIPNNSTVYLGINGHGGTLIVDGNDAGTTLNFGTLNSYQGNNQLIVNSGMTGTTTVNAGVLSPYFGNASALNITLNNNGSGTAVVTTTNTNVSYYGAHFDTLGATVTINQNGQTYFAQSGTAYNTSSGTTGPVTAITALVNDDGDTFTSNTQNYTVNDGAAGTQLLSSGAKGASTIRYANTSTLDLNGDTMTMGLGGILISENVTGNTALQNGTLSLNNTWGGLAVMNYGSGTFTLSANLTGAADFDKYGDGAVVLSGNNTLSGATIRDASGLLELGSATALGTNNALIMGDNTSILDLHGYNANISAFNSDATLGVPGSQAAALGYNTQVANLDPDGGTISRIIISANTGTGLNTNNNYVTYQRGGLGTYTGGWDEASGDILSLQLSSGTSTGITQFNVGTGGQGDPTGGNGIDASGINGTSNVITGAVSIGANTNLGLVGYGNFETLGVTTLNGAIGAASAQGQAYGTTYLTGTGTVDAGTAAYYTVNEQGSAVDTFSGTFGTASYLASGYLSVGGTGTLQLTNPTYTAGSIYTFDEGKLILPSITNGVSLIIEGSSNVTVTGTSGTVTGTGTIYLDGGNLTIAPSGSGGNVVVNGGSALYYTGGTSLFLDAGGNDSLTYQLSGNPFSEGNQSGSFLSIGTAQGLDALGTTDRILISGTPTQPHGILSPTMIGVDYANNQAGTFLTYSGSGTSAAGIITYTPTNTNINTSTFSNVVDVGTSTQTLSGSGATVDAYAVEIDQGGKIITGNNTITFGDPNTTGEGGLILNGGSIIGNTTLTRKTSVYTSLDNGTLSNLQLYSYALAKGGAGTLYVSTLKDNNNSSQIYISQGALDVGSVNLPAGDDIVLHGGVLQGNGVLNKTLGGTYAGGQIAWNVGNDYANGYSGGFSARGGSLTVTLNGGSQLVWGSTTSFIQDGGVMMFGSTTSDNVVTLTNDLNLGVIAGTFTPGGALYSRVIDVTGNAADAGLDPLNVSDYAVLSGVISQTNPYQGLTKSGNGVLYLTGDNTYTGATTIAGGALVIGSDANLGTAPTAAYALNTTPTIDGVAVTGGALTPGAVLIDSGATLVTTGSFELSGNRTILLGSGTGGLAGASNIDVEGAGNTVTFNGQIGDYVNEVGVLNKEGDGTLNLGGDSSYTGATVISGGTINLSGTLNNDIPFSVNPTPLGGTGTDLVFQAKGGSFIYAYTNADQGVNVGQQNMGTLYLNGGAATVENDSETVANTLAFTGLSNAMANGVTVNFVIPNLGAITFGSGVTDDAVMAPNAYFNGYDFAFYDSSAGVEATDFIGGTTPGTTIAGGPLGTPQIDSSEPYVAAAGSFEQSQSAAITGLLILDGVNISQDSDTTLTLQSILESTYNGQVGSGTASITGGYLTTDNATPLFIRTNETGDLLDVGDQILDSTTGGLTKSGDGTLILSNNANAYTGGTVITGGTLQLGDGTNDGNLGGGAVTNYGALVVDNNADTVIGNDIGGDGSLTLTGGITGGATVELTGSNTYSGATDVQSGTLQIGTSASLSAQTAVVLGNGSASGVLVLGDGTGGAISATLTNVSTSGTGTGNAVVGGNGSTSNLTVANNADDTFSGTLGGTGTNQNNLSLTKSGSGDLDLTGNNSYAGGTVITNGTLTLGSATALGNTSSITFDGGILQYSAANTTDYSSIIQNSTGDIQIDTNGQNVTFAGTIAASNIGGLDKTGAGTLTFLDGGNTNIYTGNISITGGTLAVGNANSVNTVYIANGAAIDLTDSSNTGYRFNMGVGGGVINGRGDDPLYSFITGTSVTFGSYDPTLAADFLYTGSASNVGTINIVGGLLPGGTTPDVTRVLMLNGNTNLIANNATVNVGNDATFDFGTGSATVTNAINLSSGSALETRGGTWTFTDVALPTAGIVTLGSDDVGGGSITITGQSLVLTGDLTLAIGATVAPQTPATTPVTLSMNISGDGGLIETAGTSTNATGVSPLTINGVNTYTGATTIDSGGLVAISGNESGTGSADHAINVEDGTLQVVTGGSISTRSDLILGNGTTSGVFVLGDNSNSNNVTVAGLNTSGTGTGNAVVNGGSDGTSTLTVNTGATSTFSGALGGSGSNQNNVALVKSNSGTLDLTGNNNTYTGGTTVNGGTLAVDNTLSTSSGTGSGAVQVNAGGVLGGSGFIAGGGITVASGGVLAPGLDPLGVASGVMTLTSVDDAPVLTLETPASPTAPAQLSFLLGAGVNPATGVGAGTTLGSVTLAGSSTYIQLTVDAAGEVVFSADSSLPTLVSIDLLNHDATGLGYYLLFAGISASDYANLTVDQETGLITGGLALFPINDQSGQLYLENGNIYVDMETVPEPGTWAMLAMGLALLGGTCYRRSRRTCALAVR